MKQSFSFKPAEWIPFRDMEVLERCRNMTREEMENFPHPNPEYKVKVVTDPNSAVAGELFMRLKKSDEEDTRLVVIFPNSWKNIYKAVTESCNRFNVSCRNLHAFCMDEWADSEGNVAPVTYGPSLGGAFLREFYMNLREDLRPPFEQIHVFTNENVKHYSQLIEEAGDGAADLVVSATGWIGHTAFIDPNTKVYGTDDLEEFLTLGTSFIEVHPITVIQNSLGRSYGNAGDLANTPAYAVTVGPRDVVNAKDHLERHNLTFIGGYNSWERMISRLQLYGPVTPKVPASIYQLCKGTVYVSEDMARPITISETVNY